MKYLTTKEAALLLNKAQRTIRKHAVKGKYAGAYKAGSIWFIPKKCIEPQELETTIITHEEIINENTDVV